MRRKPGRIRVSEKDALDPESVEAAAKFAREALHDLDIMGEDSPDRLIALYGNAYEAKVGGASLGWFATEAAARRAMRKAMAAS